jgi:hypothetical protein
MFKGKNPAECGMHFEFNSHHSQRTASPPGIPLYTRNSVQGKTWPGIEADIKRLEEEILKLLKGAAA